MCLKASVHSGNGAVAISMHYSRHGPETGLPPCRTIDSRRDWTLPVQSGVRSAVRPSCLLHIPNQHLCAREPQSHPQ